MKKLICAILLCSAVLWSRSSDDSLRESIDAEIAPRSLLLTGGNMDSRSGRYVITFSMPNDCLTLGPIEAKSRSFALYRAVSRGGFTLQPAQGELTVWTIEEWEGMKKEERRVVRGICN